MIQRIGVGVRATAALVWVLGVSWGGAPVVSAQEDRAVYLELKFQGSGASLGSVSLGAVNRLEARIPHRYGSPQFAPLYYEYFGKLEGAEEPSLVHAGRLADPRLQIEEPVFGKTRTHGGVEWLDEAALWLVLPALPQASIGIFRRNPGDLENPRTELLRADVAQ